MRHRSVRIVLLTALVVAVSLAVGVGRAAAYGLAPHADFATGVSPYSVAVGDFNGDGKQDLVTPNYNADTVSVLLGNGNGTFVAKTDYATGTGPFWVAVGDFNGDHHQDLAVADRTGNTVSVLLGNGSGGFAAKTDFASGLDPECVVVGDFNGDGKQDLALADRLSNSVGVLLGDGGGGFAARTDFTTGTNPFALATGDVNGDGKADLVTANDTPDTVSVLLGNGAGSFGVKTDYATGANPYSVVIGDFNGDGKQDLATANGADDTASVLLGDGTGSFGAKADFATGNSPWGIAAADLDGDGRLDLVTANGSASTVSVLLNNSTSALAFVPKLDAATGAEPWTVAIGDFNGDGWPDLATNDQLASTVSVLLSTLPSGTVSVTGGAAYTNQASVGLDLASVGALQMHLRNEAGAWSAWQPVAAHLIWALSPGDGAKTIAVQYQNASGVSRVASAAIVLDTKGPVTKGAKLKVVKGKKAVFKFTITEPAPGGPTTSTDPARPVKIVIRNARRKVVKTLTAASPYATNKSVSFKWKKCTLKKGTYSYKVYAYDLAGNAQSKAGGNKLKVR